MPIRSSPASSRSMPACSAMPAASTRRSTSSPISKPQGLDPSPGRRGQGRARSRSGGPAPFAANVQAGAAEMFHGVGVALARDGSNDSALVLPAPRHLSRSQGRRDRSSCIGQLLDSAGQHEAANAIYDGMPADLADEADGRRARCRKPRCHGRPPRSAAPAEQYRRHRARRSRRALGARRSAALRRTISPMLPTPTPRRSAITGGKTPGDWRFYYVRGIAYERAKQWPKAESRFPQGAAAQSRPAAGAELPRL